jgi:cytochrome c biogenesis protein CcdA
VRVVLLGLGGGLIPCWDAVLLLVVAIALNRFGFAIPLLIAFSLGLAVVLVLLGVAVVAAYRAGTTRFKDSRWFRVLPVVSAAVLIGVGSWLCKTAVTAVTG